MIKVLHKALDIIEFIASGDEGRTLGSISDAIGEKNTTCSNIVQTLLKRNYLEKDEDGKYRLGIMLYNIAKTSLDFDEILCSAARGPLEELAINTKSQCVLSILRNNKKYILLNCDSDSIIHININKIQASDPYISTTGLLLLAYKNEGEIDDLIKEKGIPKIFSDGAAFKAALSKIKKEGLNTFLFGDKIYEISAPVFLGGKVVAAVGLYRPLYEVTSEMERTAVFELLKAADKINKILRGDKNEQ